LWTCDIHDNDKCGLIEDSTITLSDLIVEIFCLVAMLEKILKYYTNNSYFLNKWITTIHLKQIQSKMAYHTWMNTHIYSIHLDK